MITPRTPHLAALKALYRPPYRPGDDDVRTMLVANKRAAGNRQDLYVLMCSLIDLPSRMDTPAEPPGPTAAGFRRIIAERERDAAVAAGGNSPGSTAIMRRSDHTIGGINAAAA